MTAFNIFTETKTKGDKINIKDKELMRCTDSLLYFNAHDASDNKQIGRCAHNLGPAQVSTLLLKIEVFHLCTVI